MVEITRFDMLAKKEEFRALISEKLGVDFISHDAVPSFLISIMASPKKAVGNYELFRCLRECFDAIGLEMDLVSINPVGDCTWFNVGWGEDMFYVGITNVQESTRHIMIALTSLPR